MSPSRRGRMTGPIALIVLAGLVWSSCAAGLMKLPAGRGTPAPDAADLLEQATRVCRGVRTITAEIAVSGSVGGHRLRGRLSAGMAAPASARLEAVAPFGQPLFIFVATGADATLLLPRDERVLEHGRPEAVLEALTGIPIGPSELRATLTACPGGAVDAANARQLGDAWRVIPDAAGFEIYLHHDQAHARWRVVAALRKGGGDDRRWRAEYQNFQDDLPQVVRLTSLNAPTSSGFDVRLALSQVEINVPLGADVFRVEVPRSADAMTLDELRQSGPLSANGR